MISQHLDFVLMLKISTCSVTPIDPSEPSNFDMIYAAGETHQLIEFEQVYSNNCPFKLSITDVTDAHNPLEPNPEIFTLEQPQLITDLIDPMQVSI